MRSFIALGVFSLAVSVLSGCAPTTTIMPMGGNRYQAMTSSSSRSEAYQASFKKATEHCQQQGKVVVVDSAKNTYSGLNKDQKMMTGMANIVGSIAGASSYAATSSSDDNQVVLKFKCVKKSK